MINKVSIGADPELFLKRNGEFISAEGLIGGTKDEPQMISDEGHAIQEDNVMVEFNIPPSRSTKSFVDNINFVKDYLTTLAGLFGAVLDYSASAFLDIKFLQSDQAKMFGCEPDFNVYLKDVNRPPAGTSLMRTCGGHIHIGYENPEQETSELIVYAMDAILGLESINLDKDDRRREMYGKAGAFRFKKYGVEYRTLSNFWIATDELMEWAYNKTILAIELVNSGKIKDIIDIYQFEIQDAIDTNNKAKASELVSIINKMINEPIKEIA